MRLFFEIAFKNFIKFFLYPKFRTYYWLLFRYGGANRKQKSKVSFNGFDIWVADHLSFVFQYREIFLEESYKFISNKREPIIIDCGTNIGMSILYYKKLYIDSKIYCFEADPNIANILSQNIVQNNLQNVEIIPKAAWIHNNGVYFNSDGADGGNISNNGNKIDSIDFNLFLSKFEIIDFIKIDIEGAEKILIPHCIDNLTKCKSIFIEYHTKWSETQNLSEILVEFEKRGYKYFIKNENKRESPFVNRNDNKTFDMQLNIFLYR
jgi:FkbM family methyltransferase